MTSTGLFRATALAGLLLGAAGAAHSESAAKPKVTISTDSYVSGQAASPDKAQYTGQSTRKTMEIEGKGRWGVKLRLDQPVTRPLESKDMEAGAFYKVTPSFRVGGAVGLADNPQQAPIRAPDQPKARVKLETTLKF